MSFEHLHYCVSEIAEVYQYLQIPNNNFYKRAVCRLIAVRIDDFLKIAFSINKSTINSQQIKDDLNALKDFYYAFFKLQRDKYGAHFQELDFLTRLESWKEINLERADFFSTQSIAIYRLFKAAPGYLPFIEAPIASSVIQMLATTHEKLDIENYPNISSDILALTRPNSGGIIHQKGLQTKAGTVKSLEILLDFEWNILQTVPQKSSIASLFTKMFILDLISFADNLIGRVDVAPNAVQAEPGLDVFITPSKFPESHSVLQLFLQNFKFRDLVAELRLIRNTTGGHIDVKLPVAQARRLIDDFEKDVWYALHDKLKNLFQHLCFTDIRLRMFALGPEQRSHGVIQIKGLDIFTFDGDIISNDEFHSSYNFNNDKEYEDSLDRWTKNPGDDSKHYFWECFSQSPLIERIEEKIHVFEGFVKSAYHESREIHRFLLHQLESPSVSIEKKDAILSLFIQCRSGYPGILAFLLRQSYPGMEKKLKLNILHTLGFVQKNYDPSVLDWCLEFVAAGSPHEKREALTCLLRIDFAARLDSSGQHKTGASNYFNAIQQAFLTANYYEKTSWAICLSSVLKFGGLPAEKLAVMYEESFRQYFNDGTNGLFLPLIRTEIDAQRLNNIKTLFKNHYYSSLVATLGDLLSQLKHDDLSQQFYHLLCSHSMKFSQQNEQELHNYAVAFFKLGHISHAVEVAKFLTIKHPEQWQHYKLLLSLYLEHIQYKIPFDKAKMQLLRLYHLPTAVYDEISNWDYVMS